MKFLLFGPLAKRNFILKFQFKIFRSPTVHLTWLYVTFLTQTLILQLLKNTPILEIKTKKNITTYAKLEYFNPTGSIKDRTALYMIEKAEKEVFQKSKEIDFMQKQIKSLQQEVGLRAGFLETMQLESSAAIEDERSKMKILMN